MEINREKWLLAYLNNQIAWFHDGNPKRPHAIFNKNSGGSHANYYINGPLLAKKETLLTEACFDLVKVLADTHDLSSINWIIGPATEAFYFLNSLARAINIIGKRENNLCLTWCAPKNPDGIFMPFEDEAFRPGDKALPFDGTITTGRSLEEVAQRFIDRGGKVLPYGLACVNTTGSDEVNGRKFISLVNNLHQALQPIKIWTPEECKRTGLCALGSEALEHPKNPENWTRLNAEY